MQISIFTQYRSSKLYNLAPDLLTRIFRWQVTIEKQQRSLNKFTFLSAYSPPTRARLYDKRSSLSDRYPR